MGCQYDLTLDNSGLVVFLYDQAHGPAIRAAHPALLEGFRGGRAELADPVLGELAARGRLVAYEVPQDDDLRLTLTLDAPAPPGRSRRAFLDLPSGRLHIESYDCLALALDPPQAPGAVVELPPGLYRLELYYHQPDQEPGPDQTLVLTPVEAPLEPEGSMLVLASTGAVRPPGNYRIEGNRFHGLVRFWEDGDLFTVNLDPPAAEALGLTAGMGLEVVVADPPLTLQGVYLGEDPRALAALQRAWSGRRRRAREFAEAQWLDLDGEQRLLVFQRVRSAATVPPTARQRWLPVVITLQPVPRGGPSAGTG